MTIYFINIFLIIIYAFLLNTKKISKRTFCIIVCIQLFLLSGLRSSTVGNDTWNYLNIYKFDGLMTFGKIFTYYEGILGDLGFHYFNHFLFNIGISNQVYLMLISLFFSISVSIFIYKESYYPELSYITLFTFNYFQFSMTGLRQTLAISFIIFVILCLKSNKNIIALLLFILATSFHASSLICILVILLKKINLTKLQTIYFMFFTLFLYPFRYTLANKLIFLVSDKGYLIDNNQEGTTMMFLYVCICLFMIIIMLQLNYEVFKKNQIYFVCYSVATFFQFLVPIQNIFFRISLYFGYSLIILLPTAIYSFKKKDRNIAYLVMLIFLLLMYFSITISSSGVTPYKFFWKEIIKV